MADENTENVEDQETPAEETVELVYLVEDGSRVIGANSYITLEDAIQYQTNQNRTDWLALSENEKKSYLIKATHYVDTLFTWRGQKKYGRKQTLNFPRIRLRDIDGYIVEGVPEEIKAAVCEAAFYAYKADLEESELFTTYDENGAIKRQRVEGAVEVEYFDSTETAVDYISKYASLNSILKGLYFEKNEHSSINARADWGY